jgi:S-adenosylmethionine hydrolase
MTQQNFPYTRPILALMTGFGVGDGNVGVMEGVIAGITPDAHIIDITHNVGHFRTNLLLHSYIRLCGYPSISCFDCS